MATASEEVETYCGDSVSKLPDEVLGQILSLLPTKLAASTSVLSKRWEHLLPLVHNLDFDESMVLYPNTATHSHGFLDFVERTLALRGDSPVKKFSLKWESPIDDESRYNHLIRNVLERGVSELHLSSPFCRDIALEFFLSKTLVKLTLSDGCYVPMRHPPGGVLFPALKTLSLFHARYSAGFYECLLSSPLLEEFNVCDDDPLRPGWVKHVRGSSIQRISIFYRSDELQDHLVVTIHTPNLVYLDYSSFVASCYDFKFDSLVEARLDLILWKYNDYIGRNAMGNASRLVAAIKNVTTLHLSADSLEVFYFSCRWMPEFNNLIRLSFESHEERSWQVLPLLLTNSPNLETLVIKGLVHKITKGCGNVCVCKSVTKEGKRINWCLRSCPVKVLRIYGYEGSCREVRQMRHFIENLKFLELVIVKVQVDQEDQKLSLTNELMKILPAASSKCTIQFL